MYTISAAKAPNNYPIIVGTDLWSTLKDACSRQTLLVIDRNVYHYIVDSLLDNHFLLDQIYVLTVDENHKNLQVVIHILEELVTRRHDRSSCLVSIGGGVLNDLVGFAASIYQRGISWITMPTTLLAQVDAAIGGKTGCNFAGLKNQIGCFYQPKSVIIDLQVLAYLPDREYIAGLAEVVKYGVVKDTEFFAWLERNTQAILLRDKAVLQTMVQHCCTLKRSIVAEDVMDCGVRMILNFGHTFAHAIESATKFVHYLHGEAVSLGMLLASKIAVDVGMTTKNTFSRLLRLLDRFGLPVNIEVLLPFVDSICEILLTDKKVYDGKLVLVLPQSIGKVKVVDSLSPELIRDCIKNYVSL